MAPIEVDGLWESYRRKSRRGWRRRGEDHWALLDVSFTVDRGEMLGIIGPNGSGKSTLLQCLAGVHSPTRGSVRTRGRVASMVELSAGLHRELTGRENLLVAGSLSGLSRAEVRARYDRMASFSGLDDDVLDSPLRTYSAGMGLRLGISVVLNSDPDVLLVDEVLAVGDAEFQERCLARVADLRAEGAAIVLVSHDLRLIERTCSRVAILRAGVLEYEGAPAAAVSRYLETTGNEAPPPADDWLYGARPRGRRRRSS
jgi:ABC-type polysaccharide/polyol phosphate transport system ATPase subunit